MASNMLGQHTRTLDSFLSAIQVCAWPIAKQRLRVASLLAREYRHLRLTLPPEAFAVDGGGWSVEELCFFFLSMGAIVPGERRSRRHRDADEAWARDCGRALEAAPLPLAAMA